MVSRQIVLLLLLWATPSVVGLARHIVGGEMYYTWLRREGNNNVYRFRLNVYLDCAPDAQRSFDQIAALSIYTKNGGRLVDNTGVRLGEVSRVAPPDNPCLIPPNICVQRGVYEWERSLPLSNDDYIVMYQICCRNETTTNLIRPGFTGNTYTVEITAESQRLNNSSPQFRTFPPTIICVNEPLRYDHSATDAEGDVLIYSFCTPLGGGGIQLGSGCNQTNPNPACWPVREVTFREPYSVMNPIGGNPMVRINPQTGLITGTPDIQGQFALVACVEEYRNGRLLSVVKRDFQFNVAFCQPLVSARIRADEVRGDTFVLRSCGSLTFNIDNLSIERSNIRTQRYSIDFKGQTRLFTDWNPAITFPDTGIYRGSLLLNEGLQCNDSIQLEFNVSPSVRADFSIQYDTCIAGPVQFTNTTYDALEDGLRWLWDFGFKRDSIKNPSVFFETPGTKNVILRVANRFNCQNTISKSFLYAPVPERLEIAPINPNACTPATVNFNNLTKPIDSTYTINWDFGDGNRSRLVNPIHTFMQSGTYSVSLSVVSPLGCRVSRNFNNLITVRPGIKADFNYTPNNPSSINKTIELNDLSDGAVRWSWLNNNRVFSTAQNPSLTFRDTGIQSVGLRVVNIHNCSDTIVKLIDVKPIISYYIPNAFTPNADGVNDLFIGTGLIEGMQTFTMKIFNRWGELIFETNNPREGWDGTKNRGSFLVQEGVYLCIVNYTTSRGDRQELRGYATLIK